MTLFYFIMLDQIPAKITYKRGWWLRTPSHIGGWCLVVGFMHINHRKKATSHYALHEDFQITYKYCSNVIWKFFCNRQVPTTNYENDYQLKISKKYIFQIPCSKHFGGCLLQIYRFHLWIKNIQKFDLQNRELIIIVFFT